MLVLGLQCSTLIRIENRSVHILLHHQTHDTRPPHSTGRDEMYTGAALSDGSHSSLLGSHFEAQKYLAPALLLLYGDVERTGFYEKLTNRRSIMVVLKHLWTLETHRPAFRGIATMGTSSSTASTASSSSSAASADITVDTPSHAVTQAYPADSVMTTDSQESFTLMRGEDEGDEEEQMAIAMSLSQASQDTDTASPPAPAPVEYDSTPDDNYFIRFANGLMNETNSLVSTTMDRLGTLLPPCPFPCHALLGCTVDFTYPVLCAI